MFVLCFARLLSLRFRGTFLGLMNRSTQILKTKVREWIDCLWLAGADIL